MTPSQSEGGCWRLSPHGVATYIAPDLSEHEIGILTATERPFLIRPLRSLKPERKVFCECVEGWRKAQSTDADAKLNKDER